MRYKRPAGFGSKMRTGFANGGNVADDPLAQKLAPVRTVDPRDDDTVNPGTGAKWDPQTFGLAAMGYARGGVVGFARGGSVRSTEGDVTDPNAWPSERTQKVQGCNIAGGYSSQGYTDQGTSCIIGGDAAKALETQRHAADDARAYAQNPLPPAPDISGSGSGTPALGATVRGYVQGGAVRRGYADGGTVTDDPNTTPPQPGASQADPVEEERKRRLLEAQAQVDADRQRQQRQQQLDQVQPQQPEKSALSKILDYGMSALGINQARADQPPVAGGQVPEPTAAPPVSAAPATGYSRGDPTDLQWGAAGLPATPSPTEGPMDTLARAPGQLLKKAGEYLTDTGPNRVPLNERITEPGFINRWNEQFKDFMSGGHPNKMSDEDFIKLQHSDPLGDHSKVIHDEFQRRVQAGDNDGALALVQHTRVGFDAVRGVVQHALDLGDTKTVINGLQRQLQIIPNGRNATVGQTADGRFVIRTAPDAGYPGESREHVLTPHQVYDLEHGHGFQFDHLAHNGLDETLDITTGKKQPLYVPPEGRGTSKYGVGYDLQPRYTGTVTDSGLPIDSPAGLMERAEVARQRGAVDKEATDYADRAKAAVNRGVPPEQVHQFLRQGGDPYAQQGSASARPDVTVDANGRPVYGPRTNIPGAGSPTVEGLHDETGFTGLKSVTDRGGRYVSGHEESVGKNSASERTSYGIRPPSYFENPAANKPPAFTGYAYGERRAGYRAPVSAEDARSMSQTPIGPQPPPGGVTPSQPSAADQVQAIRGGVGYANANAPPAAWDADTARAYNARLAGQQQDIRGTQDPNYLARREAAVARIAPNFATAEAVRNEPLRRANSPTAAERAEDFRTRSAEVERRIQAGEPVGLSADQLLRDQNATLPPRQAATPDSMVDAQRRLAFRENRPYTPQQEAADRAHAEAMQLQTTKGRTAENVAGTKAKSAENVAGTRATSAENVAGTRAKTAENIAARADETKRYTEDQHNARAANVLAQKNQYLAYLDNKATQDRIAKTENVETRGRIDALRTKLAHDIKPEPGELEAYQQVVDRGRQPNTTASDYRLSRNAPSLPNVGAPAAPAAPATIETQPARQQVAPTAPAGAAAPKQYPGYSIVYKPDGSYAYVKQ